MLSTATCLPPYHYGTPSYLTPSHPLPIEQAHQTPHTIPSTSPIVTNFTPTSLSPPLVLSIPSSL